METCRVKVETSPRVVDVVGGCCFVNRHGAAVHDVRVRVRVLQESWSLKAARSSTGGAAPCA